MEERKIAQLSAIAEGQSLAVELDGLSILLCHTTEGVFAVENKCSHQLQPLAGGRIRGCYIFCPLHGQRFSLKDGAPFGRLTDKPISCYQTRLEGDDIYLTLP